MNWVVTTRLLVVSGLAIVLAASVTGCGKDAAQSTGAPRDIKSAVDQQLERLESPDNAWLRMEAAKTLAGMASKDDRIKPALKKALAAEKEAAVKQAIKDALKRVSR